MQIKTIGFAFALCGLAVPALAQMTTQALLAAPPMPDLSAATPVGSPNRTGADALALQWKHGGVETDRSRLALQLEDSSGQTLGRLEGVDRVILYFKNEPMTVQLGNDLGGQVPFRSGGFSWITTTYVFCQSSDCSGPGYLNPSLFGTDYFGATVVENGETFRLIGNVKRTTSIGPHSIYSSLTGVCQQIPEPHTTLVVPVEASVNVEHLPKPPFFVR